MARTKSMATIENEIAEAKEVVLKTKAKHEAAIANLEAVMARKDELVAKDCARYDNLTGVRSTREKRPYL